jgi:hypothetical protein
VEGHAARQLTRRMSFGWTAPQRKLHHSQNQFSYKGDSGSFIIDLEGNCLGILHSGNGGDQSHSMEITYATQLEWLLEDNKESLDSKT